jgi:amino acid transporter
MAAEGIAAVDVEDVGLAKQTNWWGAFVIGLAGTILVTGIAPLAAQGMGASSILYMGINTIFGLVLCLCLAELACMWPHRSGGIPSYAAACVEPLVGKKVAAHVGGFSSWSYWLGWFPVAPINMILAASYIETLFNISAGKTVDPLGFGGLGSPIAISIMLISFAGLILVYIPSYLGIKLGAGFATVLGVVSMIPITLLILLPFFNPSKMHWSNIAGFHLPHGVVGSPAFFFGWMFPITWNVIAMEAAACYVGECRGGARDAKIAMTAEGIFGVFIYVLTPLVFIGVLGLAISTYDPLTLYTQFTTTLFGEGSWVKWAIGLPLLAALLLSVLNAIMGVGRSLYQASEDGVLPRWFGRTNRHGVPARAMGFNVIVSAIVVLFGSPARIYIFSNAGYLFACAFAMFGYFIYRQMRPDEPRPYKLWGFMRWVALAIFLFWCVVYFYGGWNASPIVVGPGNGPILFILGLVIMALYFPLAWWRKTSDKRHGIETVIQTY